jgi:hypothetical protein
MICIQLLENFCLHITPLALAQTFRSLSSLVREILRKARNSRNDHYDFGLIASSATIDLMHKYEEASTDNKQI